MSEPPGESCAWMAERYTSDRVLAAIGPDDEATSPATIVQIAARAEIAPHRARVYVNRFIAQGIVGRMNGAGRGRYYRKGHQEMTQPEPQKRMKHPTRRGRLVAALAQARDLGTAPLTLRQIAESLDIDKSGANNIVQAERKAGMISRVGKGGNDKPYRYQLSTKAEAAAAILEQHEEPVVTYAPGEVPDDERPPGWSPVVSTEEKIIENAEAADREFVIEPPESDGGKCETWPTNMAHSYEMVAEDLKERAATARRDAEYLTAGAELLERVRAEIEGEQ